MNICCLMLVIKFNTMTRKLWGHLLDSLSKNQGALWKAGRKPPMATRVELRSWEHHMATGRHEESSRRATELPCQAFLFLVALHPCQNTIVFTHTCELKLFVMRPGLARKRLTSTHENMKLILTFHVVKRLAPGATQDVLTKLYEIARNRGPSHPK